MSDSGSRKAANPEAPDDGADAETPGSDPPASAVRPTGEDEAPPSDPARAAASDPANDVDAGAPKPPPPDEATRKKRLENRIWHRQIVGWLFLKKYRRVLTEDEANDVLQDTCVRALKADPERWPFEEDSTLPWLMNLAFRSAVDLLRARGRRRKIEVPLEDHDVAVETDAAVEAKQFGKWVAKTVADTPELAIDFEILDAYVGGMDAKVIAEKFGIRLGAVYRSKDKASSFLRSGWTQAAAAIAVGFLILFVVTRFPSDLTEVSSSGKHPGPDALLPALPPHPTATQLRVKAFTDCRVEQYGQCLMSLNRARRLDPEGEKDPEVRAAREKAEATLKALEKGKH